MNLILIGARCTGKTSAGRRLAERLGWPFFDADEEIVRTAGKTVDEIVADEGWPAFRERERAAVRELSRRDRSVIAVGGGAVLDPGNVEALKRNGLFIRLAADAETIRQRMERDQALGAVRPSLSGRPAAREVREILAEREPLYRRIADLSVDSATRTEEEVVAEILEALQKGHLRRTGGSLDASRTGAAPDGAAAIVDGRERTGHRATGPNEAAPAFATGENGAAPPVDGLGRNPAAEPRIRRREK